MPLSNQQINDWCKAGGVSDFEPLNINPASIDLRWSGNIRVPVAWDWSGTRELHAFALRPNTTYLLDTLEYIKMPLDLCGMVLLKTRMGRGGTFLGHVGWVDPGFEGTLTFQLHHTVPWTRIISKGERLIQLVLSKMDEVPSFSYGDVGNYNGQKEPTAPK